MNSLTSFRALAVVALAAAASGQDGAKSPERLKLAFAPPKGSSYLIEYIEDETWDRGDRKGESHVLWTMRHKVLTVSKKGRVFLEGAFLTASYRAEWTAEGGAEPTKSAFRWSQKDEFTESVGDAVERVGKKEIPLGLKVVLDPRGAAEKGEC